MLGELFIKVFKLNGFFESCVLVFIVNVGDVWVFLFGFGGGGFFGWKRELYVVVRDVVD